MKPGTFSEREYWIDLRSPRKRMTKDDRAAITIAALFTYTRRQYAVDAARALVKRLGKGWSYKVNGDKATWDD